MGQIYEVPDSSMAWRHPASYSKAIDPEKQKTSNSNEGEVSVKWLAIDGSPKKKTPSG
jgi:hypothetical protein